MNKTHSTNGTLVRIVKRLEQHGLDRREYSLYDLIDPSILERITETGEPTTQLRFQVHGSVVRVYGDGRIDVRKDRDRE